MSNCCRLPPALLDLTFSRAFAPAHICLYRHYSLKLVQNTRRANYHGASSSTRDSALDTSAINQSFYMSRQSRKSTNTSLSQLDEVPMSGPVSELEKRVIALKNTVVTEESITGSPTYSENELLAVYEDLLDIVPQASATELNDQHIRAQQQQIEEDSAIVHALAETLLQIDTSPEIPPSSFAARLLSLRHSETTYQAPVVDDGNDVILTSHSSPEAAHQRVVVKLQEIVSVMRTLKKNLEHGTNVKSISTGIMTFRDWAALIRVSLSSGDGEIAETALSLMKRFNETPPEELVNEVLAHYANSGDAKNTDRLMKRIIFGVPTDRQRDLHVKAHLRAAPPAALPEAALSLLHDYESRSLPAPIQTYTRLITALFLLNSSPARAHAWDLFAHMRYAAHPYPDAALYTYMIRACASPRAAYCEPERALDLFTEMTTDQAIPPTAGAYTATILACARSGQRVYVHEGFRLAKEMLDAHRDAHGRSAFRPDMQLFLALLDGAKRIGDLERVRWILAEIVRGEEKDVYVDERVMMHVFHAYASYRPPFRREATVVIDKDPAVAVNAVDKTLTKIATTGTATNTVLEDGSQTKQDYSIADHDAGHFLYVSPQTRADVLAETETLFKRIVEDRDLGTGMPPETPAAQRKFRHVELTPRLFNSYLSVHYAHASLEIWCDMFNTIFSKYGVSKTARSYIEFLERCARVRRPERRLMPAFVAPVWEQWRIIEEQWRQNNPNCAFLEIDARTVERAYAAMIRIFCHAGDVDNAIALVRSFVKYYPPQAIQQPQSKHTMSSTRTVLVAQRPLVRLTSAFDIPDDTVPPLLTFTEIDLLHLKLVALSRTAEIKYLKWVCKAYEGALRQRRDNTMRALPTDSTIAVESEGDHT